MQTLMNNYASIASKTFLITLLVEFLGVMVFTFLGSTVNDKVHGPWSVMREKFVEDCSNELDCGPSFVVRHLCLQLHL